MFKKQKLQNDCTTIDSTITDEVEQEIWKESEHSTDIIF